MIRITNTAFFDSLLKATKKITSEIVLSFNVNQKVSVNALGTSSVSALCFSVGCSSVAENKNVAVRVDDLLKALKNKKEYSLAFDNNCLVITSKNKIARIDTIIESDVRTLNKQITPGNVVVNVQTSDLLSAITDAELFSDRVIISTDESSLTISGHSSDGSTNNSYTTKIETVGNHKVRSKYSTTYFGPLVDLSKVFDACELSFGNDYPLLLSFANEDGCVSSLAIAPTIDND